MRPKLTTQIMSRRRLAAAIQHGLSYGEARPLAAFLGLNEGRVSRALKRPDEFTNDFDAIARSYGYERSNNDGFYKRMEVMA